ncbi:MAG TPA: alpha/beta hydrolase [Polyangiaceae bacterium]|jgi:alpha-beta hydrolase superfamily lysophospholipase|nr:alpha/beta hydrolase [Polyangiaceae bacterium]
MKTERGSLARTRTKGPVLYFSSVAGDDKKAIVGIVPGYADYADRYEAVQRAWAERGLASVAIDLRGHGHAEGPRGACREWNDYMDDVRELFVLLEARAEGKPILLFGHSFGGLVAASWTCDNASSQKALVLSAPFMRVALPVPALKKKAGRIVSKLLPSVGLASGLRGDQMTSVEALQKQYDTDPLVFKKANARWFTCAEDAQADVMSRAKSITLPLYVAFGTDDGVVAGARELYEAAGSTDKKLDVREGLRHEILFEPTGPAITAAMADWMLAHAQ